MNERPLNEVKTITVGGKNFHISKIPSIPAREVLLAYSSGKKGELAADSASTILRLLSYCEVEVSGEFVRLSTEEFINAQIPNIMDLMELEKEMMAYNFGFFKLGAS